MSTSLSKLGNLRPLNDDNAVNDIWADMLKLSKQEQQKHWLIDARCGRVFVFKSKKHPNKVLEYVEGTKEDSVSTLYEGHIIFNDLAELKRARTDIINEIGMTAGMLPSVMTLNDMGRERDAHLSELGTAQLLDTLAQLKGTHLAGASYGKH